MRSRIVVKSNGSSHQSCLFFPLKCQFHRTHIAFRIDRVSNRERNQRENHVVVINLSDNNPVLALIAVSTPSSLVWFMFRHI